MSLSDAKIRSIKPSANPFILNNTPGLYLLVSHSGNTFGSIRVFHIGESGVNSVSDSCQRLVPFYDHAAAKPDGNAGRCRS